MTLIKACVAAAVSSIAFIAVSAFAASPSQSNNSCFVPSFDMCTVTRVVDGDTFQVNCRYRGNNLKVRVLGIDTYESRYNSHLKKQTKNGELTTTEIITRGLTAKHCAETLALNKPIILVFKDRRYDMYNRLLATVFVVRDSQFESYVDLMNQTCPAGVFKTMFREE